MAKLESAHKEQIRSMINDGKANKEIIEFFAQKYNLKLGSGQVSFFRKPKDETAQKKRKQRGEEKESIVDIAKDIIRLQQERDEDLKEIFLLFRGALIKSKAEAQAMKQASNVSGMTEKRLKVQVIVYLKSLPDCWIYTPADRWIVGIPDFIICHKGKFKAIELKNIGKKLKKEGMQEYTLNKIKEAQGNTLVAHSLEEVKAWME